VSSLIATSIEWYDFFLYSTAAAIVFPEVFLPRPGSYAGTLESFATYAAGFAARPWPRTEEFTARHGQLSPAAAFSSRKAAARRGGCQDALRPLGFGRIQRRAAARRPGWGPISALGRANAVR
jgi:hypothetical protein